MSLVHGTATAYLNGCRCTACRAANTERHRRMRAQRIARGTPFKHGTRNGYMNYGCRCGDCRAANAAYERERRRRQAAQPPGAA